MTPTRTFGLVALGLVFSTYPLRGQDRSRYREFQLGRDVASISALTGVAASEVRIIHARPALTQELQWRRGYSFTNSTANQTDPVQQIVFSFYNDQLAKLVVDYDRERTLGLTDADMIEAISTDYGEPLKLILKNTPPVVSRVEAESGDVVARWGDADYSVVLYRSAYGSGFRIVVISTKLEALARTAEAQAVLMDEREAPLREIARQKKDLEDTRASQEKARAANKSAFRP